MCALCCVGQMQTKPASQRERPAVNFCNLQRKAAGAAGRPARFFLRISQVVFGLEDGSDLSKFEYQGRLAGLFAGVVIRF